MCIFQLSFHFAYHHWWLGWCPTLSSHHDTVVETGAIASDEGHFLQTSCFFPSPPLPPSKLCLHFVRGGGGGFAKLKPFFPPPERSKLDWKRKRRKRERKRRFFFSRLHQGCFSLLLLSPFRRLPLKPQVFFPCLIVKKKRYFYCPNFVDFTIQKHKHTRWTQPSVAVSDAVDVVCVQFGLCSSRKFGPSAKQAKGGRCF